ncbi:exocyst complex subunit Sec15-like-domain-containing protein [Phakopsora pachyrhizi]|uniref:Exocyst complex subunit Sec15-like-domain-containing protein n=1 Tax=Phakopsora pachyrhizi TaxID=170000 RepID=A0AAV0AZE2_PHAPC|nr:exocyst complex subunit Sec15-like-domain-containing protein [Phakopsora pachyrhizi]
MNQPSPKLTTPKTPNLIGKRKKTFFSHSDIKSQLQKLSLYSDISSAGSDSNNHFGLQGLVNRLLSIRRGINSLRSQVITLDSSIQSNETKKVALNINDTIETIQACLRVLSLSRKVEDQISNQSFYSSLRALDELEFLHIKPLLSFATFAQYLGEALLDGRIRAREEVTRQLNSWFYETKESSRSLGRFAIEGIEIRIWMWKSRNNCIRRKNTTSLALLVDINTPAEVAFSERYKYNPINHLDCQIFLSSPYTAIHIYNTLEFKKELQESFKDNQRSQAHLILPSIPNPHLLLDFINCLIKTIIGFFIIESHILCDTKCFRNQSKVKTLEDLETFMDIKNSLLFYNYLVYQLNKVMLTIAKKCRRMLEEKFTNDFDQIVGEDDYQPMDWAIYRCSDEVLRKKISNLIYKRVKRTRNLSRLSQILLNLMFFKNACVSVEDMLHQLKINLRAQDMRLDSLKLFQTTLKFTQDSIQTQIYYKINDFFELALYNWTEES